MAFLQVTTQRQINSGIAAPRRSSIHLSDTRPTFLTSRQRAVKRVFDLVVSFLLICLILPLMVAVALLLYLEDPACVLQKEVSLGAGGKLFSVYKFRTRPRIVWRRRPTHLENYLAASGIDRLPMLFNVLRGEMSLVGPNLMTYAQGFTLTDARRADLRLLPGLYHIRDKRAYLEHYSLWSDVRLLLQIVVAALK